MSAAINGEGKKEIRSRGDFYVCIDGFRKFFNPKIIYRHVTRD